MTNDAQRINNLTRCAQLALFGLSYSPLLIILAVKTLIAKAEYLHWGGCDLTEIWVFVQQFWAVTLIICFLVYSSFGTIFLLRNLKSTSKTNQQKIIVKNIADKSAETISYIATYIIPFVYDVQNGYDMLFMLFVLAIIYLIYVNSSLVAINPILAILYGLYEIEYEEMGKNRSIIVIASNKYIVEGDEINIYPIGRKLYFSNNQ